MQVLNCYGASGMSVDPFALARILGTGRGKNLGIVTLLDPVGAKVGQSARQVDPHVGVGVWTGSVVNRQRRVLFDAITMARGGQSDFPVRYTQIPRLP